MKKQIMALAIGCLLLTGPVWVVMFLTFTVRMHMLSAEIALIIATSFSAVRVYREIYRFMCDHRPVSLDKLAQRVPDERIDQAPCFKCKSTRGCGCWY